MTVSCCCNYSLNYVWLYTLASNSDLTPSYLLKSSHSSYHFWLFYNYSYNCASVFPNLILNLSISELINATLFSTVSLYDLNSSYSLIFNANYSLPYSISAFYYIINSPDLLQSPSIDDNVDTAASNLYNDSFNVDISSFLLFNICYNLSISLASNATLASSPSLIAWNLAASASFSDKCLLTSSI